MTKTYDQIMADFNELAKTVFSVDPLFGPAFDTPIDADWIESELYVKTKPSKSEV
jgi:hypothetical protein